MKNLIPVILLITTPLLALCQPNSCNDAEPVFFGGSINCNNAPYKLVFFDDFKGTTLNTNNWYTYWPTWPAQDDQSLFSRTHDIQTTPATFKELQVYKDENVIVSNGTVKLRAKQEQSTWYGVTKNYTSGWLQSKTPFKYGKIEIRFKLPYGRGFWPALWLFGAGQDNAGHNKNQEIDFLEFCGEEPQKHHITYHYKDLDLNCDATQSPYNYNSVDLTSSFNTIVCEFNPYFIKVFLNGVLVRYEPAFRTIAGNNTYCGNNLAYATYLKSNFTPTIYQDLIMNLALSSNNSSYCNGIDNTTPFPSDMEIDYVKVWQQDIQWNLTDLCSNRDLTGDDYICLNENKTYTLTGAFGDVSYSVSSNLEIVSSNETSITINAKPNTNGQVGHLFINEINSPCGSNFQKNIEIKIGLPPNPAITSFGCGNGFTVESNLPFTFTWDNNNVLILPPQAQGPVGSFGYSYLGNFTPTLADKACIPYIYTSSNMCGTTTKTGFIYNNCYPLNSPLQSTLCARQESLIDMTDFGQHLTIFPNPATQEFAIKFTDRYNDVVKECKIYNCISFELKNSFDALEEETIIPCSSWETGNYMVILKLETGQTMASLVSIF